MDDKNIRKNIKIYGAYFSKALRQKHIQNDKQLSERYENKMNELYRSKKFEEYAKYRSLSREKNLRSLECV